MPIVPDTKDWTWVLAASLPGVRLRQLHARVDAGPGDGSGQRRRMARRPRRRACAATSVGRRLVGARVRLPRARRLPAVRRAIAADARGGRSAVRQLGSGRDRDRAALRPSVAVEGGGRVGVGRVRLAARFEIGLGDQWERTGRRSDGAVFTVDTFARYFVHDPIHHLHDVAKGFTEISGGPSS